MPLSYVKYDHFLCTIKLHACTRMHCFELLILAFINSQYSQTFVTSLTNYPAGSQIRCQLTGILVNRGII